MVQATHARRQCRQYGDESSQPMVEDFGGPSLDQLHQLSRETARPGFRSCGSR
jgi:hypothetical protein